MRHPASIRRKADTATRRSRLTPCSGLNPTSNCFDRVSRLRIEADPRLGRELVDDVQKLFEEQEVLWVGANAGADDHAAILFCAEPGGHDGRCRLAEIHEA